LPCKLLGPSQQGSGNMMNKRYVEDRSLPLMQTIGVGDLPLAGDLGLDLMTSGQMAEARRIFDRLDKDKDEKLHRDELVLAFYYAGLNPTVEEVHAMATEQAEANRKAAEAKQAKVSGKKLSKKETYHDPEKDRFEFVDFLTLIHKDLTQGPNDDAELLEAFSTFDDQQNGHITRENLKAALCSMGKMPLEEEEADRIVALADREKDGLVNYVEFVSRIGQVVAALQVEE